MTPVVNAVPGSPESRYTEAHIQTRNCIERLNGVLKGRFLCLSKILRYSPDKVGHIANACAILHNMCQAARQDIDFDLPPHYDEEPMDNRLLQNQVQNREGNIARRNLIQLCFNN